MSDSKDVKKADTLDVTIVVPSYNRADLIGLCLQALSHQATHRAYEIIVVDSSDDGTNEVIAKRFPDVTLKHFPERVNTGAARNIGIMEARGSVILFIDTDCVAGPNWLEDMYSAIFDLDADGVGGSIRNGTPWSIGGCVGYYLEFFRAVPCRKGPWATPLLIGGNSGFRRQALGQQAYRDLSAGEDYLLSSALAAEGKRLFFLPQVSVTHLNRCSLRDVLSYQLRLGKAAYEYRRPMSPGIIHTLREAPLLALLLPAAILPWIATTLLIRRRLSDLIKFAVLLPLLAAANFRWSLGLRQALKEDPVSRHSSLPGDREDRIKT